MKTSFYLFAASLILAFAGLICADDFKSETIPANSSCSICPIRVRGGQFIVIKNFTQDDLSNIFAQRGLVTVTRPPNSLTSTNVLTASVMSALTPEIINNVVIAGPADVSITCGDTLGSCFITYRKDSSN